MVNYFSWVHRRPQNLTQEYEEIRMHKYSCVYTCIEKLMHHCICDFKIVGWHHNDNQPCFMIY